MVLQVGHHGQDDGLILVVAGKAEGGKVGQAADVVDKALEVELHLEGAVPVLKGEHGPPVEPEVGAKHLVIEVIGDLLVLQRLVGREEELHDLHGALIGKAELAVSVGVLAAVDRRAAEGVVGVGLVQPVILVQHADPLGLQRRDGAQQVPHDLKMVVHLAAAPHHIAHVVLIAVAGPAGDGVLLEHMHMPAFHLAVPHQIAGRRQGRQTGTDEISRFVIDALRLFRRCKSLIVATGIVHRETSLFRSLFRHLCAVLIATVYPAHPPQTTSKTIQLTHFSANRPVCIKNPPPAHRGRNRNRFRRSGASDARRRRRGWRRTRPRPRSRTGRRSR